MQLTFYENEQSPVYTPTTISNLMELFNEIGIGCNGCGDNFENWNAQDVYDGHKKWQNGHDAILLQGQENKNPHFIVLTCVNDICPYGTSIDKPSITLKHMIEQADASVLRPDGMQYPLVGKINSLNLQEAVDGNYTSLILGGNNVMVINDVNPQQLKYNQPASELYEKHCYEKRSIYGNVVLSTPQKIELAKRLS